MNTVFAFRGEWFEKGFQGVLFLHSNSKGGDVSSAAVSCFARHVSRAVTSSCRGNICQRALCPFVCICTHLTKTLAQSLYPAPTSPFSNESLPWRRPLCSEGGGGVSWQQITCCFRRADTQARCCCGGVCHRSLSLSLCVWRFELLLGVCHLTSAVVNSYRAVISASPWRLTPPAVSTFAFIFTVAILSQLTRFTSVLISCFLMCTGERSSVITVYKPSPARYPPLLCLSTANYSFTGIVILDCFRDSHLVFGSYIM